MSANKRPVTIYGHIKIHRLTGVVIQQVAHVFIPECNLYLS
jgi:hypothetical protein